MQIFVRMAMQRERFPAVRCLTADVFRKNVLSLRPVS